MRTRVVSEDAEPPRGDAVIVNCVEELKRLDSCVAQFVINPL